MMREILFRGKVINRDPNGEYRTDYKNGDWVYGLVTNLYDDRFPSLPAEMTNEDGVSGIEVDYRTIGEWTGLTDKNGVKIFEGDMVSCNGNEIALAVVWDITCSRPNWTLVKQSEFYAKEYSYRHSIEFDMKDKYEVVGSIYDNAELLKEDEE